MASPPWELDARRGALAAVARLSGSRALHPVGRLAFNVGRLGRDLVVAAVAARMPRDWLLLRLDRGLTELPSSSRWLSSWAPAPLSLSVVLEALEYLEGDSKATGVLIRMGAVPTGWAKLASIARALARVRQAGKRIVVYASHGANGAAWLGSLAHAFWMAPAGRLDLVGVRIESPFVRGALERFRVRPLVLQAGRYKSVGEMLERDSMSEDARSALEAVVDDLYATLLQALARRAGSEERAREWIDRGPYLAAEAFETGLVDRLLYPDELPEALAAFESEEPGCGRDLPTATSSSGGQIAESSSEDGPEASGPTAGAGNAREKPVLVAPDVYVRMMRPRFRWRPVLRPPAQVIVVPIVGAIDMDLARLVQAWLAPLRERSAVKAVVLRIDSPGGDPAASDLIWHAVKRLRASKPVVASMGDTAASGGYYAAMAANAIVAEETTLTGSIGVAMAGVELREALRWLGVQFDGVQRGKHAGMFGFSHEHSAEERELLERQIRVLYDDFVAKAAEGRQMTSTELDAVAQGRVWSGAAAAEHGLVDLVGGLPEALDRARLLAGLDRAAGDVVWLAPPTGLLRRLLSDGEDAYDAMVRSPWSPGLGVAATAWCPVRCVLR